MEVAAAVDVVLLEVWVWDVVVGLARAISVTVVVRVWYRARCARSSIADRVVGTVEGQECG